LRVLLYAQTLRARRVLDLRLALEEHVRQKQGRVERFHAFRLVVQHLVGARDLALTRLGARRSLGAIGGAARRLLRGGLRRASGFFVLAASLFDVVGRVGSEVGTSARFVRRVRRDADFLFFFASARFDVSSRLVQNGIGGSVATRAAGRSRTSSVFGHRAARASLRALRCARSSSRVSGVMVASRSCAWTGRGSVRGE
jgi:hypothetical protein